LVSAEAAWWLTSIIAVNRIALSLVFALGSVLAASGQGGFTVRFERDIYQIQPGQTFVARVLMQPQSLSGLFSYAILVQMDALKARVSGPFGISVPDDLEFNGVVGAGAYREVGEGFAGVKGTVDFFGLPLTFYQGSLLAAFEITDQSRTLGEYPLNLRGFNTLGPTEQLFVDGGGQVLDNLITFRGATVQVVPEPTPLALLLLGGGLFWLKQRPKHLAAGAGCRGDERPPAVSP
jgi:hypothetical protein